MTRFEWDAAKAESNIRKHGISFETAIQAFSDPFAMTEQDRITDSEYRWQTIGIAKGHLMLLVAHTVREDGCGDETIRIISARRAAPKERRRYEEAREL